MIRTLPTANFTVVYTTTPIANNDRGDNHDGSAALGSKLKLSSHRIMHAVEDFVEELDPLQLVGSKRAAGKPKTSPPPGGVFERYQFLSPGMGMPFISYSVRPLSPSFC